MVRKFILIISLFVICLGLSSQQDIEEFRFIMDSIVNNAIDSAAFPGAQVLVMHNDSVLHHKAYGFHTFEKVTKVETSHLYDLASLTKVLGGGMALMRLQEKGMFSPNEVLGESHPFFKRSDKADISWREILAHQSGMEPYIVFWRTAINQKGQYKWRTFANRGSRRFNIQIDSTIFLHRRYPRKMHKLIKTSNLREKKTYLYSGLGFLLIPDLVRRRTGKSLDHFLSTEIFQPLGATRICYQPTKYFSKNEIVPTENDTFFRKKLVHGYVHDENAAMFNGVSANAGLFSNAKSIALIAKLLLDSESNIISHDVVKEYTSVQFPENDNRRGLAFDKPSLKGDERTYIADSASPASFGHSGFTGTFLWIDPEKDLVLIFLSNRVHPYRGNRKLYSMNFRPQLHQAAYDYLEN